MSDKVKCEQCCGFLGSLVSAYRGGWQGPVQVLRPSRAEGQGCGEAVVRETNRARMACAHAGAAAHDGRVTQQHGSFSQDALRDH